MYSPSDTNRHELIHASVICIRELLEQALAATANAQSALEEGKSRNLAIGWLIDIERQLQQAQSLYQATLCLHREGR